MTLPGVFVVGTDTGVGKTRVASEIARAWTIAGRKVGVFKPVATGAEVREGNLWSSDAHELIEAVGGGVAQERVTPILFEQPLAPPVAARVGGGRLEAAELIRQTSQALDWWRDRAEVMVVEGVGGLLCPIAEGWTVADLAIQLDYPLIVVAHRGLGTLNHTLLTVEAALARSIRVAGVILNGARPTSDPVAEQTNAQELSRRLPQVAILAEWEHQIGHQGADVASEVANWYDLARLPRNASEDRRGECFD